jgi:CHAD domain-containing protein
MAEPQQLGPGDGWRRATLRLVRSPVEPEGPISPELVLVSPELGDAVRATPDTLVLGEEPAPAVLLTLPSAFEAPGPEPHRRSGSGGTVHGTARYDTGDLLLERHGLVLELDVEGLRRRWRLMLPRGETVEAEGSGDDVPERISSLLRALADGGDLRRVPVRSDDPRIRRLESRVRTQLDALRAHDPGVRVGADPENLHQLRVAARRLRTFLAVARDLVDAEWARELKAPLRDLGRASGPPRDLDVLIEHLREQVADLDGRDREAAAQLIAALEADRAAHQAHLVDTLDGQRHSELLERLGLPVPTAAAPTRKTLEQLAAKELRGLLRQVRSLGKAPADRELHALRIRVKRVRYAAELGGLPGGARMARVIRAATLLQDILGEHNDAAVAEERIRGQAYRIGSPQVAFVAGRLAERQRQRRVALEHRLPPAWKRLRGLARKAI